MTWVSTALPGDWTTVASGKRNNIFYVGDTLAFTLTGGQPSTYKVRDITGSIVASGTAPTVPGTLTLTALNPGYYKLYLERGSSDPTWLTSQGECEFHVWRNTTGFPARPATGTSGGSDPNGIDLPTRGMMLAGPWRHAVGDAANLTTTQPTLAMAQADLATEVTWYTGYDTTRTKIQFLAFPNGTSSTAGVTSVVNACGAIWYEGRNEPQGTAAATYVTELQTFYNTVKAANASAKVMGPAVVGINATNLTWWDQFFAAGGGNYLDGISFHDYNSLAAGDIAEGKIVYDRWVAILTKYGQQNKPRFMTEWGTFAAQYGSYRPVTQARCLAAALMLWEQYGVPKEHVFWFYDWSHGFWSFPSWWMHGDGSLTASATVLRVWSEELYGKTYASALDFGAGENKMYLGNKFTGTDGSATIALISAGRTDGSVQFTMTGASSFTLVDAMGNTSTLTPDGSNKITITVGVLPVYLRVPNGCTATLVQRTYGRRVDQDYAPSYTILSSGAITSLPGNGTDESGYDYPLTSTEPRPANETLTLPASWTINFWKSNTIDTVVVRCPPPWQGNQGAPLDFDVQTWDGAAWQTQATFTEATNTINWLSRSQSTGGAACFTDSYWSDRHLFVASFSPVRTTKIRLFVRSTSKGGEPPEVDGANNGQGTGSRVLAIREVECYYRALLGN